MKIQYKSNTEPVKPTKTINPAPLILLAILAVFGLMFAFKHFEDAFENVDGQWVMKRAYKEKVGKKMMKPYDCDTYELVAIHNGFYPCKSCEGGLFFLNKGEIYKIGFSCNKEERYSQGYYAAKSLKYFVVLRGNAADCQAEEARLLGAYPLLPENLARPDRTEQSIKEQRYKILYPIGNSKLQ